MDSASPPSEPIFNVSTWTFEEVQAWADRPNHHDQELERIRAVTISHAQDDHLAPEHRKRWAKLSLQVNAHMNGDGPWQQARMAANNFRLRTLIIIGSAPTSKTPTGTPSCLSRTSSLPKR